MGITDFLKQTHIQEYLSKDDLDSVFACWDGDTNELSKFLINSGVDPLEYLYYIPFAMYAKFDFEEFIVPSHIQKIHSYAFSACKNLKYIYIPEGVTHIGYHAFKGCPEDLVIGCKDGSFAYEWAGLLGIKTKLIYEM